MRYVEIAQVVSETVFLSLPFGKTVTFSLSNHGKIPR